MGFLKDIGSELIDGINSLLADTGEWAADILNAGAKAYHKFIAFAYQLVTKDIQDSSFNEFWEVIDFMNSVFVTISSTVLVMLFFYTLYESSTETRSETNLYRIMFDYVKLILCNFLVANSLTIVIGIFKFGTNIAVLAVRTVDSDAIVIDPNDGLAKSDIELLQKGVSGLMGLLIVIIALIGAIVMIASAITIIMEIIKRFYKIFTTLPFASLSFCTFVLPDGKGNELFRGYIKNTVILSLEASIIVFCLVVSTSLIGTEASEDGLMSSLFEMEEDIGIKQVELDNETEVEMFNQYCEMKIQYDKLASIGILDLDVDISASEYEELGDFDYYYVVPESVTFNANASNSSTNNSVSGEGASEALGNAMSSISEYFVVEYPVYGYVGNSLGLGNAILLVVKCLLPMFLTAAVIKEVPNYAGRILAS